MLGYGVNAYFDILYQIMCMFIVVTIVCIPLLYVYSSSPAGGVQLYLKDAGFKLTLATYSLGNLGGATVVCG